MGIWAAWMPAIITLVTAIFIAGQITGRIKDQEKTLVRHDKQLGDHEERLNDHSVKIAETKAWTDGYRAARDAGTK